jgi:hypothetical protein
MISKKIEKGGIYAVHSGTYAGELLVHIKTTNDSHCFLATPTMKNRVVPLNSFDVARNSDIIKFVEKAPRYVMKVSTAQYKANENSDNRRK